VGKNFVPFLCSVASGWACHVVLSGAAHRDCFVYSLRTGARWPSSQLFSSFPALTSLGANFLNTGNCVVALRKCANSCYTHHTFLLVLALGRVVSHADASAAGGNKAACMLAQFIFLLYNKQLAPAHCSCLSNFYFKPAWIWAPFSTERALFRALYHFCFNIK
jgi:hypothetical protein